MQYAGGAAFNAGELHADVAADLGIFKSEVGYAMHLHRRMKALGTNNPWVPLTQEEAFDCFKRVRNPAFSFQPLDGFENTRHPKAA